MVENVRGNLTNVKERGEYEQNRGTYIRFELLDGRNGGRRWDFDNEWILGALMTGSRESLIPSDLVDRACEGGMEEETKEVDE